jgi:hypothetical protein
MPSRRCLPPVEYSRGTSPSHAARSRPLSKTVPLPTAATSAVAFRAPIPGISQSHRQASSRLAVAASSASNAAISFVQGAPFRPQVLDQVTDARRQPVFLVRADRREPRLQDPLDPTLEQDGAQLVDQGRAAADQSVAHAMDCMKVQLCLTLQRHDRMVGRRTASAPASASR